jgi:hypothetical protein
MMDLAQTEEDSHIRQAGVRIVVASWPADTRLVPWLRNIAWSEVDLAVRREALLGLIEVSTESDAVHLVARLEADRVDSELFELASQILKKKRGDRPDG